LRKEYKQTAAVWLGVLTVFVAALAVQTVAVAILRVAAPDAMENASVRILLSTLPMYAVGIPLATLVFRFADPMPPTEKRSLSPATFAGVVAICFALALVGSLFGQAVNNGISAVTGREAENPVEEITRNVPFWLNLLVVGVCAPVAEEFVYRKCVIDRTRRYGDGAAVLISALLFGAIHGNFTQFFYAVFLGAVFGAVYCATGKLRYTIALHMLFNCVGTVSSEMLGRLGGEWSLKILAQHPETVVWLSVLGLIYLASVTCAPVAAHFLVPKLRPARETVSLPAGDAAKVALLNPALWALVAMIVYLFVF